MNKLKISLLALSIVAIAGCNGGDDNGGSGGYGNNAASEAHTRATLTAIVADHDRRKVYTNYVFPRTSESKPAENMFLTEKNNEYLCNLVFCSLDGNSVDTNGVIWRHEISDNNLVPIYYALIDGAEAKVDPRVTEGLKAIESAIGRKVFEDKGFINFADSDLESVSNYNYADASDRGKGGLIISVGTAHQVSQRNSNGEIMCGSVSSGPHIASIADLIVNADGVIQSDKGWVWVNLGNPNCNFNTDIVKHELAHYLLSYSEHFDGMGENGAVYSESTEAVLHTLYNNAIGAPVDSMAYTWDAR